MIQEVNRVRACMKTWGMDVEKGRLDSSDYKLFTADQRNKIMKTLNCAQWTNCYVYLNGATMGQRFLTAYELADTMYRQGQYYVYI